MDVVRKQRRLGGTIHAHDPLLSVNRQQYATTGALGRSQSDDPIPTVPFAERSLFDCASGGPQNGIGQNGRVSRKIPISRGGIQETKQRTRSIKNWRRQAALGLVDRLSVERWFAVHRLIIALRRATIATDEPFVFIKE